MNFNFSDLERLIKIAENSRIHELEILEGLQKIRITTQYAPSQIVPQTTAVTETNQPPTQQAIKEVNGTDNTAGISPDTNTAVTSEIPSTSVPITSPMVGTFYRSADPAAKPLVQVNDTIMLNQTLCIIEAMKIMHEVKAEKAGILQQILVNDGDMVEYAQPLFIIT